MDRVTFFAGTHKHYADHLMPIWRGMPEEVRGEFWAKGTAYRRAESMGTRVRFGVPRRRELVVVASYDDHKLVAPSKTVMVNHGIGQSYQGRPHELAASNPSYSGGAGRERVVLFLEPNESAAQKSRKAYPGAKVVVCGVPVMDEWHSGERQGNVEEGLVALTFHSDAYVCPETRWAFPYFRDSIRQLAEGKVFRFIGHGHPRVQRSLQRFWDRCGVEFVSEFDEVCERAACLVWDNTSAGPLFASLNRPTVVLSAAWYRRDVQHGLRFWDRIPGVHVEHPCDLADGIQEALTDPRWLQDKRRAALSELLPLRDGRATERAVAAVMDLL